MADTKISALTALTGAGSATDDVFPIVDTSATTTKKITRAELAIALSGSFATAAQGATADSALQPSGTAAKATVLETARTIDGVSFNGSANITVVAPATHAATEKTVLVAADEIAIADSAASYALKKATMTDLQTFFKASLTANGYTYLRVAQPLNQSGSSSVLPRDVGKNAVTSSFGASTSTPWVNAGYFSVTHDAAADYIEIPNSAIACNLSTDSLIWALTINHVPVAGSSTDSLAGFTDASSIPGLYLTAGQISHATGPNKIGARLYANSSSQLAATWASATVSDSTDHRVMVAFDATTKVLTIYVDGVLGYTSGTLSTAAGDNCTGALRLGQPLVGSAALCKLAGNTFSVFAGTALPINIDELARADNISRRTGIYAYPIFI